MQFDFGLQLCEVGKLVVIALGLGIQIQVGTANNQNVCHLDTYQPYMPVAGSRYRQYGTRNQGGRVHMKNSKARGTILLGKSMGVRPSRDTSTQWGKKGTQWYLQSN